MRRKTFADTGLQAQFEQEGYVTLQLLDGETIAWCRQQFEQNIPAEIASTFYTSHWSSNEEYRRKIDGLLRPVLANLALPHFENHKAVYAYFLVKNPGNDGYFHVHQDWTLVDETRFSGATVWCPLVDMSLENGAFHVVEKSHLLLQNIRGSHIDFPYSELQNIIEKKYLTEVSVKAGEAIIFDQRLWHASPPNLSEKSRVAIGLVVLPKEAEMIHHYHNPDAGETQVYQGGDDFLLKFAFGDRPEKLKPIGIAKLNQPPLSEAKFDALYKQHNDKMDNISNLELVQQFYQAFSEKNADKMAACYHPEIQFSDPAFGHLKGKRAVNMWRMLISRNDGSLKVELLNAREEKEKAFATWKATYNYGPKKRKVVNVISAEFEFQDGKIIKHTDTFNLWKWTRMALGFSGLLLGWTPFMRKQIQAKTNAMLDRFIK